MSSRPEPKFVPGERVLIVKTTFRPELVGRETNVIGISWGPYRDRADDSLCTGWRYYTPENKANQCFSGDQLRKLPPNTPSNFDETIWKPQEITQ